MYNINIKTIAVLIAMFSIVLNANSQNQKALELLDKHKEVYLSLDTEELNKELHQKLSLDYIDGKHAYVYANHEAFQLLNSLGVDYTVERSPGDVDFDVNMKTWEEIVKEGLRNTWDYYPTYDGYVDMMYQFETDYPDLIEIYDIGNTVLGRDLLFAKITSNVSEQKAVPRFMYTSTIHGDETTGFVLLLRLIDYLASNYGEDTDITAMLDNVEIWICPNENPDGTYRYDDNTISYPTRYNENGVDLNRNYPNPVSQHSTQEMETLDMMSFVDTMGFVMSANMHGGIELVNYPYDSWTSGVYTHADHDWFEMVSYEYADTAQYYSPSGYMTAYGGVTHGGDWYVVYGSRQDYLNIYNSTREITLELSDTKFLPANELPDLWEYNYRSFINYIKQSTYGFSGTVKDYITGDPIEATIEVIGHEDNYSAIKSRLPFGNFNRPILAGTYDLLVSAPGYYDFYVENATVTNYQTTDLEILMQPYTHELSLLVEPPESGEVTGAGSYAEGEEVLISATANEGYSFISWTIDDDVISNESEYIFTMPGEDVSITANFSEGYLLTIEVDPEGAGVVSGEGAYPEGEEASITATANEGYVFDNWSIDGDVISNETEFAYTMPANDVSITANFSVINAISEVENVHAIYPNPSGGEFSISSNENIIKLYIYGLEGTLLYSKTVNNNQIELLLSDFESGIYLLQLITEKGTTTHKLQIMK